MGEKPIWGIPRVFFGNIELGEVNIKDGLDFQEPSDIKGSIDVDWCNFDNIELAFDVQLTKKDTIRLRKMLRTNNRFPRKLEKAIKKYLSKCIDKPTNKIKFSFK